MSEAKDAARPWEVVLQVAGALGGLAGLVYTIGATTIWLRARLVGLPADVAVEHEPRSSVIALGLRGIVLVAVAYVGVAVLAAALIGVGLFIREAACRLRSLSTIASTTEQRVLLESVSAARSRAVLIGYGRWNLQVTRLMIDAATGATARFTDTVRYRAKKLSPHPVRIAGVDLVLVVGASFWSWRALAAVASGVAAFGSAIWLLDVNRKRKTVGILGFGVAALLIGLGWQINGGIPVQAVVVTPPSLPRLAKHPVPYFGETDQYIYVGVLQFEKHAPQPVYLHQIEELKRSSHLLTFRGKPFIYCREDQAPALAIVRLFAGATAPPKLVQC
jgi:hypothetical protein